MWITVSVEDDKLKINIWGQSFLLSPVSKTSFQALDAPFDISLEFAPEVKGKARKAKLTMRGREGIDLVKAPIIAPLTHSKLKEYVGEYYSDELMTTYRVVIEEGKLVIKHRYDPMPLKAMAPDEFSVGRMNIEP